ncbi:MAG: signal recognition particle protein, partial [Chitinivibrionales bacterium]|nr:signal recognition particle protein [Chitinivibrionales bacterium]
MLSAAQSERNNSMFEDLNSRLEAVFKKLRGRGRLTEENISEAMRDVRRALLEADVNFRVAKEFIAQVQEKAVGTEVLQSITPGQQVVKIVQDELTSLMGGTAKPLRFHTNRLNVIVMSGLQGSGKTTACAKLALHLRKQGHRPLLVACDTHRAAAIDQLQSLGRSLGVETYADREKKPVDICRDGLAHGRREGFTVALVDTAGRL